MKDSQKKPQKKTNVPFWEELGRLNLSVIAGIFFAVLAILFSADLYFRYWIFQNNLLPSPVKQISLSSYPQLASQLDPDITAAAAVAIDDGSKAILFNKNANLRFTMASTTKIMTALVGSDYFKPNDVLTTYTDNVPPVVVGFPLGEKIYFKDILYAMLLPSGNDAALEIAQNYPGGEKAFVEKMNEKAKEFNLKNTHFEDSTGFSDNNYSTPLEMARMASEALKNKTIAQIVSTQKKTITDIYGTNIYKLSNLDVLLGKDGINGVKTGYTEEAGGVLITSRESEGKRFILVVMKSLDRFTDIEKILSQIENNVTFVSRHP